MNQVSVIAPPNIDMETLWHTEFNNLFNCFFANFGHIWKLSPSACSSSLPPAGYYEIFKDSAKVRYLCKKCGQGWTSMKGCVYFWYWLDVYGSGVVLFQLLGQKCQKCNDNRFEDPLWYPEEVSKVLRNIYYKVGQTYYGFMQPTYEKGRRPGKPRSQHPKELCEACQKGFCTNNRKPMPFA